MAVLSRIFDDTIYSVYIYADTHYIYHKFLHTS
nr:MAG TPA: hypothetical protein [Caudoviricetes sp.]